jgi:hypothetical protein
VPESYLKVVSVDYGFDLEACANLRLVPDLASIYTRLEVLLLLRRGFKWLCS